MVALVAMAGALAAAAGTATALATAPPLGDLSQARAGAPSLRLDNSYTDQNGIVALSSADDEQDVHESCGCNYPIPNQGATDALTITLDPTVSTTYLVTLAAIVVVTNNDTRILLLDADSQIWPNPTLGIGGYTADYIQGHGGGEPVNITTTATVTLAPGSHILQWQTQPSGNTNFLYWGDRVIYAQAPVLTTSSSGGASDYTGPTEAEFITMNDDNLVMAAVLASLMAILVGLNIRRRVR